MGNVWLLRTLSPRFYIVLLFCLVYLTDQWFTCVQPRFEASCPKERGGSLHPMLPKLSPEFEMDETEVKFAIRRRKFRSLKRRKRRFQGNQFSDASSCKKKRVFSSKIADMRSIPALGMPRPNIPTTIDNNSNSNMQSTPVIPHIPRSATSRKIAASLSPIKKARSTENGTGFRFMDLDVLGNVLRLFACPHCDEMGLKLYEIPKKKMGCASCLQLHCFTCGWIHEFYTSAKSSSAYNVNVRLVYAMRSIGQGFAGAKRFCGLMNMPNVPTKNNFNKILRRLKSKAFKVAEDSMAAASKELFGDDKGNEVIKCGVSVDGTWQKRGYASLNGSVAALSIDTGKVLDIEPMS